MSSGNALGRWSGGAGAVGALGLSDARMTVVPGRLLGTESVSPATIIVVAPCAVAQQGQQSGRSPEGLKRSSQGAAVKFCYDRTMQNMLRYVTSWHGVTLCDRS